MAYRQILGKAGEEEAADFLKREGFSIMERNVRCGRNGEIDIVAAMESLIVFVEVKKRRGGRFGGALYSISERKKHSLRKNAQWFIASRSIADRDIVFRFDLLAIEGERITWVQDILR